MYWNKPGPVNTEETLKIAVEGAEERGIEHLVIASTMGDTAKAVLPVIAGTNIKLVVVTHNVGFSKDADEKFSPEIRAMVEDAGHDVLTGTMVTRNINKAISTKLGGFSHTEIINATLRMFCQGLKVCPEIASMAADAGLVPIQDIVAVAGTGRGADTAVVLKAQSSNRFFDIKIREILCKPKSF